MFTDHFKREYFKALGIPRDLEAHKHALDTAHRIREFEIQMYWKRALYFWGFQVVLFATVGNLVSKFTQTSPPLQLIVLSALCVLGTFISILWLLMTKGAKFWQDNWERHVDLLEDNVHGSLYKTYPIHQSDSVPNPPFSVSKINEYVIWMIVAFWIILFLTTSYILLDKIKDWNEPTLNPISSAGAVIYFASGVLVSVFLVIQFVGSKGYRGLRMNNPGAIIFPPDAMTKENESRAKKDYIRKR